MFKSLLRKLNRILILKRELRQAESSRSLFSEHRLRRTPIPTPGIDVLIIDDETRLLQFSLDHSGGIISEMGI
jgi:hypothetical protein